MISPLSFESERRIISSFHFLRKNVITILGRKELNEFPWRKNSRFFPEAVASRRERFPCSSNAFAWPLGVAFACANWQVVTVIHKWAGSREHSILRSRRGHLIVIIVTPNAAPCRHSHAYRRHQEVTRSMRVCRNRIFFPRARARARVFTSGGTFAEVFHVRRTG